MASTTSKKRNRGDKTSKSKSRGGEPASGKKFATKLASYKGCRALLEEISSYSLPERDEDDQPSSLEDLFTRLASKSAAGLSWTVVGQSLTAFWSDDDVEVMKVRASDLEHQQTVDLLVEVFTRALEKGHGGEKKDALSLDELSTIAEWLEDILVAVQKQSKGKVKVRAEAQLASPSDSREDAPSPSLGKSQVKKKYKKVRIDANVQVHDQAIAEEEEEEDQLESEDDLLVEAPPPKKSNSTKSKVKQPVKPTSVKSGDGASNSATGARSERAQKRVKSKDGGSTSGRPKRSSTSAQTPTQARKKYEEGDVLLAMLPANFRWPAMILDRRLYDDDSTVEGTKTEEAYLVALLPSHERYWIPPSGLSALGKPRAPADLVATEAREFAEGIALLKDDVELQKWMDDELRR